MFRLIQTHYYSPCSRNKLLLITVTRFTRMASTSTSSKTSTSHSHKISLFKKATEVVYAPLDKALSGPSTAEQWKPPSNPGAGGHLGRYLWTDAFGVLNFITLSKECHNQTYLTLAKRLAETVHSVLGRTRDLKSRLPLSTESEPLKGGLRIGKMDEFGSDGDGQYHHYLTLWMFALNRLALATQEGKWNDMAVELARGIHPYFVFRRESGVLRMVWKVSMDLRSVLVPSEGHLDAATGYVVYSLLKQTAKEFGDEMEGCVGGLLEREIGEYKEIMGRKGGLSVSSDPLDLGMGLWMCHFFRGRDHGEEWAGNMGEESLEVARRVLDDKSGLMMREASRRLAFREFGTCMGLKCYGITGDGEFVARVEAVLKFWERYLDGLTEEDFRPISVVMFATALIPGAFRDGYLERG